MKTASIIAAFLLISGFAEAKEQTFQLTPFSTLSLARGMNVTVMCGEHDTLVVRGNDNLVDNLSWSVNNSKLTINNAAYHESGFDLDPDKLDVIITTTTPIHTTNAQFGVSVDMNRCSFATNILNLNGKMGASYTVSGTIERLNLNLRMGADFNQTHQALHIKQANVELSMGAEANICKALDARGQVSMGAEVIVGQQTNTDGLQVSIAGKRSIQACQ